MFLSPGSGSRAAEVPEAGGPSRSTGEKHPEPRKQGRVEMTQIALSNHKPSPASRNPDKETRIYTPSQGATQSLCRQTSPTEVLRDMHLSLQV